jgi:serine/threonine protein phosphatase PrpC
MKSLTIKDYIKSKANNIEKNQSNLMTRSIPLRSNSKPKTTIKSVKIAPIANLHTKINKNIPKPAQSRIKSDLNACSKTINFKRNYANLFESLTIKQTKKPHVISNSKSKEHKRTSPHLCVEKLIPNNTHKGRPTKSPIPIDRDIITKSIIKHNLYKQSKIKDNDKEKNIHNVNLKLTTSKSKEKFVSPITFINSHLSLSSSKIKHSKSKSPNFERGKALTIINNKNKKNGNDVIHLLFNKLQHFQTAHTRSTSANTTIRIISSNNKTKCSPGVIHKIKSNNKKVENKANTNNIKTITNKHVEFCNSTVICQNIPSDLMSNDKNEETNINQEDKTHEKEIEYNIHNDTVCSQEEEINNNAKKHIQNIYEFTRVGFDGEKNKDNNQDSYFVKKNFMNKKDYVYLGVCDGHGVEGHHVSNFICENLPIEMCERLRFMNLEQDKENESSKFLCEILHKAIKNAFVSSNDKLIYQHKINSLFSGTTCVSVIYTPTKLILAHIGDSRAVLGKYDNKTNKWSAVPLTRDHKPTELDEKERIIKNEGRVQPFYEDGEPYGPMRVWVKDDDYPGLAMTRSFGDRMAATVGVISEPEIKEYDLSEDDKFLIIASDGIWEFISNEECVNLIKDFYLQGDGNGCINNLYELSRSKWLKEEEVVDDTTILLVFFE